MRTPLGRLALLAVSGGVLSAFAYSAASKEAEYAVHWDTTEGGPRSASAVMHLLDLTGAREDSFEVRFYDAPPPASAPDSARTIFRERSRNGGEAELVVKYRRATPLSGAWSCPLGRHAERSMQVDIAFGAGGAVSRTYTYECEESADSFPASLHVSPRACPITFTRVTTKGYKIETWPLPGGHQLLELSRVGRDSEQELAKFRTQVDRLLAAGARPISVSKTELESHPDDTSCGASM